MVDRVNIVVIWEFAQIGSQWTELVPICLIGRSCPWLDTIRAEISQFYLIDPNSGLPKSGWLTKVGPVWWQLNPVIPDCHDWPTCTLTGTIQVESFPIGPDLSPIGLIGLDWLWLAHNCPWLACFALIDPDVTDRPWVVPVSHFGRNWPILSLIDPVWPGLEVYFYWYALISSILTSERN